jgi:hypothetical protein
MERILDFTLDGLGNIYVLDQRGTVTVYASLLAAGSDTKLNQIDQIPLPGTDKKRFRNPSLIAVNQEGVIYVSGEREVAVFR